MLRSEARAIIEHFSVLVPMIIERSGENSLERLLDSLRGRSSATFCIMAKSILLLKKREILFEEKGGEK